ncbi:hypothetical protein SM139_1036 [Stenotrophomonas maltophilia]|nr:hypothetical protein SM139_1036 [Stenotrophomonas maltophilia]
MRSGAGAAVQAVTHTGAAHTAGAVMAEQSVNENRSVQRCMGRSPVRCQEK